MKKPVENIKYIKLFFLVVLVAAAISLFYKGFALVKESAFKHATFNYLMLDYDAYLIHVDNAKKKTIVFKILGKRSFFDNKSLLSQGLILGIPIDGNIVSKKRDSFSTVENNFINFPLSLSLIFNPGGYRGENINSADILKLLYLSKTIPESDRKFEVIKNYTTEGFDETGDFKHLFIDEVIFNESESVQVVNGTGVDGLALLTSDMLKNAGFNVVSQETGNAKNSKILARNQKSEAVMRLASIFNIPIESASVGSIADITIVLGKDIVKKLNY